MYSHQHDKPKQTRWLQYHFQGRNPGSEYVTLRTQIHLESWLLGRCGLLNWIEWLNQAQMFPWIEYWETCYLWDYKEHHLECWDVRRVLLKCDVQKPSTIKIFCWDLRIWDVPGDNFFFLQGGRDKKETDVGMNHRSLWGTSLGPMTFTNKYVFRFRWLRLTGSTVVRNS